MAGFRDAYQEALPEKAPTHAQIRRITVRGRGVSPNGVQHEPCIRLNTGSATTAQTSASSPRHARNRSCPPIPCARR
jgi:hypothetical protein